MIHEVSLHLFVFFLSMILILTDFIAISTLVSSYSFFCSLESKALGKLFRYRQAPLSVFVCRGRPSTLSNDFSGTSGPVVTKFRM